jgi:hypothetical protein
MGKCFFWSRGRPHEVTDDNRVERPACDGGWIARLADHERRVEARRRQLPESDFDHARGQGDPGWSVSLLGHEQSR